MLVVGLVSVVGEGPVDAGSGGTSEVAGGVDVPADIVVGGVSGSVVVVTVVVTGTRTAGTSWLGGGGSGRTMRYSTDVAANTPRSTSVDERGRPVTVSTSGHRGARAVPGFPRPGTRR